MSKLLIFKQILEQMHSSIGSNEWLSSIGTSLETYVSEIPTTSTYFNNSDYLDLNNAKHVQEFSKLLMGRKVPSPDITKIQQRMNFYQLLGIIYYNNAKSYSLKSNNLDFIINDRVAESFLKESAKIFNIIINTGTSKYYRPCIKIFTGFYVYALLRVLGRDDFNQLKNILNKDTVAKINELDLSKEVRNGKSHSTLDTTYEKFWDRYFAKMKWEHLEEIGKNILSNETNYWCDAIDEVKLFAELTDTTLRKSAAEKLNKIKILLSNEIYKDAKKEKIIQVLRSGFGDDVKRQSDYVSDIIFDDWNNVYKDFLESAHIIPVNEILALCTSLEFSNEKRTMEILELFNSPRNGILLPFNYHLFYDNNYIKLSNEESKFTLTKEGEKHIESLTFLGYHDDHKIREHKYNEIMKTLEAYELIKNKK